MINSTITLQFEYFQYQMLVHQDKNLLMVYHFAFLHHYT